MTCCVDTTRLRSHYRHLCPPIRIRISPPPAVQEESCRLARPSSLVEYVCASTTLQSSPSEEADQVSVKMTRRA